MKRYLINVGAGSFTLSRAACERLMQLGVPRVSPTDAADEKFTVVDLALWENTVVSLDPKDAEGPHRWVHSDYQYEIPALHWELTYRNEPRLLQVWDEMGPDMANKAQCCIKLVEVPDDVNVGLAFNGSGAESIVENHRVWR